MNSQQPWWFRVLFFIGLMILVFLVPAWVTLLVAIIASFFFQRYFELPFTGLFLDFLYHTSGENNNILFGFLYVVIAILCFVVITFIKKRLFI